MMGGWRCLDEPLLLVQGKVDPARSPSGFFMTHGPGSFGQVLEPPKHSKLGKMKRIPRISGPAAKHNIFNPSGAFWY